MTVAKVSWQQGGFFMKPVNNILVALIVVLTAATVGCGQGFKAQSGSNTAAEINDSIQKAEEASRLAEQAMADAHAILKEITDENGNINVGLFTKSKTSEVETQFILNGVTAKLREVFDKVFAKVAVVKEQFALARQKLTEALAKLDQNNPAHSAQIQELMAQIARIGALETQFSAQMHSLASKLDLAISGLNGIITGVTSWIPGWGSLVGLALDFFVMSDLKALIMELKAKLMAL